MFAFGDEVIDVRDVIEQFESLESDLQAAHEQEIEDEATNLDFNEWLDAVIQSSNPSYAHESFDDAKEYRTIEQLLSDLAGYGGDEFWRGDWYPVTLIHESHFEQAMDEMLEDCGDLPANLPCYLSITVDYEMLKQDYSEVCVEGNTYLYR